MMTAYNLRRIINILGIERFREYLQYLTDLFFGKTAVFDRILAHMLAYLGKVVLKSVRELQCCSSGNIAQVEI